MSSLSSMTPKEAKGGPFGWIRQQNEPTPSAPAPVEMPTIDAETVRRARLRAQRRMVAQNQGRESTILGGSNTTLGGA
jgi:hypothetical protein